MRVRPILGYLLGRRFWFDEGRRQMAVVVGLYSASDVWVALPGGRRQIMTARYVREAVDERGVDCDGKPLPGPVDWALAAHQANFGTWSQAPRPSLRHHPESARRLAAQIAKAQEHVAAAPDDKPMPAAKRLAQAGDRLWSYRIQKRMSQSALGRATGVSQHVISVLEHGRYCPTSSVRARICEVLGAPENAIWGMDCWTRTDQNQPPGSIGRGLRPCEGTKGAPGPREQAGGAPSSAHT